MVNEGMPGDNAVCGDQTGHGIRRGGVEQFKLVLAKRSRLRAWACSGWYRSEMPVAALKVKVTSSANDRAGRDRGAIG
ncbi:MAG: hypothetical protein ACLFQ1_00860, partial [Halochromatium sp.]